MNVSKLAAAFTLATSLAAFPAVAQVANTAVIRQPAAMTPSAARSVPAQAGVHISTPAIEQPAPYTYGPGAVNSTPAAPTGQQVQQPAIYATTPVQPVVQPNIQPAVQSTAPVIQQPGIFVAPPAAPAAASTALLQLLQQPSAIGPPTATVPAAGVPATSVALQQPAAVAAPPTSSFASYYDEDDEEADDENEDDDHDVGCGDDCERESTCCGWTCGGWIEQGITFNGYNPHDGFNGTVIMNDLANQWMGNQFWLYTEREIGEDNCGWDYGGRVDLVYGTDAFFMQMKDGLEESWDQNDQYLFSPLRFYLDLAYNNWTLRAGRFDNPVGYEPWDATESFLYSRSYAF
jgi:hypothetical protein